MVKKTQFDKILNWLSLCLMIVTAMVFTYQWMALPDTVPVHSDMAGNVDRYGSKIELLILPVLPWILYGFLSLVERFPKMWNTMVEVTQDNRDEVYSTILHCICSLKFLLVAMMCGVTLMLLNTSDLVFWFIGGMLILMVVVIIYWMQRVLSYR